jgi:hypothetical protein
LAEIIRTHDWGSRFQVCAEITDAVWRAGFDSCRTDWERANWVLHYRDYCLGERLVHYDSTLQRSDGVDGQLSASPG